MQKTAFQHHVSLKAVVAILCGVAILIALRGVVASMLSLMAVSLALELMALPICRVLEKRLGASAAAALSLLLLLAGVFLLVWGLIPPLVRQVRQLMLRLPTALAWAQELLTALHDRFTARGFPSGNLQSEITARLTSAIGQAASIALTTIQRLSGSISQWLLSPLIAFYLLRDRKQLCTLLTLLLPLEYRARGVRAAREMRRETALYFRGQLLLSCAVGVMTAAALFLTHTPGAVLLGLLMGVLELIPYIGPVLAGLPAVLLSLQSGWTAALWTLLAICAVQQMEANLLSPRLLSGATRLHPLTVLLSIAFGGMVGGAVGMMLILPAVVCVRGAVRGWRCG